MRQPLVAGNWKMHGTRASVSRLMDGVTEGLDQIRHAEVVVCPPFVYLADVGARVVATNIGLGAQDLCATPGEGAHTGEVSGAMLRDVGCSYVIVGHSERRALYGEDDAWVADKFFAAREAGLVPILCVGELLEQRERGETENVVAAQLDAVVARDGGVQALDGAVIAYEPVWAIGTGKTATPGQAQDVHAFIRERVAEHSEDLAQEMRILYGGSVKPGNAAELFAMTDIDGGLIGGASLAAEDFLAICRAAA